MIVFRNRVIAVWIGLFSCFGASTAQAELAVSWKVENRFRFYREDTGAFKNYEAVAETTLKSGGKQNWILRTENELQRQYRPRRELEEDPKLWNGWASLYRNDTCWDRQRKTWTEQPGCEDFVAPESHGVSVWIEKPKTGTQCTWSMEPVGKPEKERRDYWEKRKKKNNEVIGIARPCAEAIRLEVPYSPKHDFYTKIKVTSGEESGETEIAVTDVLVLGMGDSFAAGVGNPDKPAQMDWGTYASYRETTDQRLPVRVGGNEGALTRDIHKSQAEWMDIRCFRSQYGPQFRAALHLAVSLKHGAVTFLDLACDGSRMIEGLLHQKVIDSRSYAPGTKNPPSQIGRASYLLCADRKKVETINYRLKPAVDADDCLGMGAQQICEFAEVSQGQKKIVAKYQNDPGLAKPSTSMTVCRRTEKNAFRRDVDILLLSIGGNDIGFAPMVADVIIDDQGLANRIFFRGLGGSKGYLHPGSVGLSRLALLKSKYEVLDKAITKFLPLRTEDASGKKPIFLTAYPLPVDNRRGALCGANDESARAANAALDVDKLFARFRIHNDANKKPRDRDTETRLAEVVNTSCALNLRRFAWFDGGDNADSVIIPAITRAGALCDGKRNLYDAETGEKKLPWQYVAEFLTTFESHGFCAIRRSERPQEKLAIPKYSEEKDGRGVWTPSYLLARPYDSRQRWIRTPNDVFVSTNWHSGEVKLQDYLNLVSAATTSAMHPTAEGYAAMADAVLQRVSKYLCSERRSEFKGEAMCSQ